MILWTKQNRGLLARASQCLSFNRELFPESDAQMMTVINLAESNGYLDLWGPIRRQTLPDGTSQLFVGNDNGTIDVSAWMINNADTALSPSQYAVLAFKLWRNRGWKPWVAYNNRAQNKNWSLFQSIVEEAVMLTAIPAVWEDAKKHRKI